MFALETKVCAVELLKQAGGGYQIAKGEESSLCKRSFGIGMVFSTFVRKQWSGGYNVIFIVLKPELRINNPCLKKFKYLFILYLME